MGDRVMHSLRLDARHGEVPLAGDPDVPLPWWSFTKTVIAACALALAEGGVLDLDAPLPGRPFTLRLLLGHRAGVADYGGLRAYHAAVARGDPPWPRARLLAMAGADRALFEPGDGWAYSNIGYLLAREHMEARSGRGLGDLVQQLIAGPLGLQSVRLAADPADFDRIPWPGARSYHPGWVYHGCLTGSARDAARLLDALLGGRLLRPPGVAAMLERRPLGGAIAGRPWTRPGYGLGLMTGEMAQVGRAIGHSGGGPFSVNAVYRFPDLPEPATVACFTDGTEEGVAEAEAARIAAGDRGPAAQ